MSKLHVTCECESCQETRRERPRPGALEDIERELDEKIWRIWIMDVVNLSDVLAILRKHKGETL